VLVVALALAFALVVAVAQAVAQVEEVPFRRHLNDGGSNL
jgi:hypothetical protein